MNQTKHFASQADLEEKRITFSQISEHAWAYTAEGDPNTGIIIGDDAVLVAIAGVAWVSATRTASSPMMIPVFGSPSAV